MWDKDFYWIFEDHVVKKIHVVGYYYNTDSDNGHGTARLVMYGYYVMPLSEFLTIDRETYESEVRQYIEEFTTEKEGTTRVMALLARLSSNASLLIDGGVAERITTFSIAGQL